MIHHGGDSNNTGAIALLGGVFDPVHQGHVDIALSALHHPQISAVHWIPCARIPHHKSAPIAPAQARLEMVHIACSGTDGFVIDDIEYHREGPSYTADTVKSIATQSQGETLLWIVGADNARNLAKWKSAEELWNIAIPLVAPRPGVKPNSRGAPAPAESSYLHREDFPYIDDSRWQLFCQWQLPPVSAQISSSQIRESLRNSKDFDKLSAEGLGIPSAVLDFIVAGGWYQS